LSNNLFNSYYDSLKLYVLHYLNYCCVYWACTYRACTNHVEKFSQTGISLIKKHLNITNIYKNQTTITTTTTTTNQQQQQQHIISVLSCTRRTEEVQSLFVNDNVTLKLFYMVNLICFDWHQCNWIKFWISPGNQWNC
jgi:hypothetical protein